MEYFSNGNCKKSKKNRLLAKKGIENNDNCIYYDSNQKCILCNNYYILKNNHCEANYNLSINDIMSLNRQISNITKKKISYGIYIGIIIAFIITSIFIIIILNNYFLRKRKRNIKAISYNNNKIVNIL